MFDIKGTGDDPFAIVTEHTDGDPNKGVRACTRCDHVGLCDEGVRLAILADTLGNVEALHELVPMWASERYAAA